MVEVILKTTFSSIEAAKATMLEEHPGDYRVPWRGVKDSAHIENLGMVVGFRDESKKQRWRIDYDPDKGLHINRSQDLPGGAQKACRKIRGVRNAPTSMADYMIDVAKTRHDEIPAEVKSKLGSRTVWTGRAWVAR